MKRVMMDLLLLYVREDGIFLRFLSASGETRLARAVDGDVTEETLTERLSGLVRAISDECGLLSRRVTVAFALSRRVEVLRPCVSELLRGFRFSDSVTELSRDELLLRARARCAEDGAGVGLLYCDTRETRLFTEHGEIPLSSGRTGGNGFCDWLLSFVTGEEDSFEHYAEQEERLWALFRAYRCFAPYGGETERVDKRILPDRAAHPLLYGKRTEASAVKEALPDGDARIAYTALTPSERARVDKKYPALYGRTRDRRGREAGISMETAAERFRALFDGLSSAAPQTLAVVGRYAHFPLTLDLLASLPLASPPSVRSEEALLLDGMEDAVVDRIASARLVLRDLDGDAVTLWESRPIDEALCPEKRIALRATLRRFVSDAEWKRGTPKMPYTLELVEPRRAADGSYKRIRVTKMGDLRDFCYRREPSGGYRLRIASSSEEREDSAFRTVLVGISATPSGVYCRLLKEETGASS